MSAKAEPLPDRLTPLSATESAPARPGRRALSNGRIAVVMLVVTEIMLFTSLIGAFLVLRGGQVEWPPAGLPRLPVGITAFNTMILLGSAATMFLAVRLGRGGSHAAMIRSLSATLALGTAFLAIQGFEWVRLIAHGLSIQSGTYGATFYTLIGAHGVHVVAAVVWLAVVFAKARRGQYRDPRREGVELAAIYWYFVCAVWPVLFGLVYLS